MNLNDPNAAGPEPDGRTLDDCASRYPRSDRECVVPIHGSIPVRMHTDRLTLHGLDVPCDAREGYDSVARADIAKLREGQRFLGDGALESRARIGKLEDAARELDRRTRMLRVVLFVEAVAIAGLAGALAAVTR